MSNTGPGPNNSFEDLLALAGVTELAVASTGTAYGYSFPLPRDAFFAFELQMSSGGTIDVKVELEVGNARPATEGSSDSNFVVADTISSGIVATTLQFLASDPPVAQYGRLKFTGQGSNAASTKVTRARLCVSKNR